MRAASAQADLEPGTGSIECDHISAAPLERGAAERIAVLLKVIADPTRLQLLSLLLNSPGGEACVCDLTEPLGFRQPTISHHLRKLVEAGVVRREKRGTWVYYSIVTEGLDAIANLLR